MNLKGGENMLFGEKCRCCGREYSRFTDTHCPYCDEIDFLNIDSVTVIDTEMTYRIETEEEFDPVMTNFITDMDGWQHYETKTIEYEVENGYAITFLICFTNGTSITRTYHELHPIAQRLQNISESSSVFDKVIEGLREVSKVLAGETNCKETPSQSQSQIKQQPKENFIVIDFETTGLNYRYNAPDMDEILSVSIINQDGKVLLNTLCNTERKKYWYNAQRVHGISPQDVQGYPTFAQILQQVLKILSSVDFVIAYNIVFERNFVESYIKRTNSRNLVNYKINWAMHKDPMHMYAESIGSRRWTKLEEAAKSYGYKFNAHDSLEDVKATLFLYNQLK